MVAISNCFSSFTANHLTFPSSKACQKSGPFPPPALPGFDSTMTPSDSRLDRRPERRRRGCWPRPQRVSPVARITFPACHAHYPGESVGGARRLLAHPCCLPVIQPGRHPRFHFRGLLRLHSRYGPPGCSTAQGGLCHEASVRSVTQPNRSSATRPIDNYLGGTFLHW